MQLTPIHIRVLEDLTITERKLQRSYFQDWTRAFDELERHGLANLRLVKGMEIGSITVRGINALKFQKPVTSFRRGTRLPSSDEEASMAPGEFDAVLGQLKKEEGQTAVLQSTPKDWRDRIISLIRFLAQRRRSLAMDDVREWAVQQGIPEPGHKNAWGAIFRTAANLGIVEPTDEYRKSRAVDAHARMIRVWQSKIFMDSQ